MKTRFNRYLHLFIAITMLLISTLACGLSSGYGNTPEGVTRKLFDSLQENDANKYLDAITPEDRQQPGFFFYRQLIQGLFGGLGLGSMEASKPKIGFTSLKVTETSREGDLAAVEISGKLRDLNFALEQDFSTQVIVKKIDGQWLVDLSPEEVTTTPGGEVQVVPTQEPCRGWKFHVIEVEQKEEGGWIYYEGRLAVENTGSDLAPSFEAMDARSTIGDFTLTTAEGYTYEASWMADRWAWMTPAPRGIRFLLGSISAKAASGTTKHVIQTLCGPLDLDNPETNFRFPTEPSSTSFMKIGDPITLPEGILTITSAVLVPSTYSGNLPEDCDRKGNICVRFTFSNPNKGYDASINLTVYTLGDDGIPEIIPAGYIGLNAHAGPSLTVEGSKSFPISSTNNLLLVLVDTKTQTSYVIDLDKLDAISGVVEELPVAVVQITNTAVLPTNTDLYRVVHVVSNDVLNIREGAGVKYKIVGRIPYDGQGVQITGKGVTADNATWVPIIYEGISGWVNKYYLKKQ